MIRNPCLKCERLHLDKSGPECTECDRRLAYVEAIGDNRAPMAVRLLVPVISEPRQGSNRSAGLSCVGPVGGHEAFALESAAHPRFSETLTPADRLEDDGKIKMKTQDKENMDMSKKDCATNAIDKAGAGLEPGEHLVPGVKGICVEQPAKTKHSGPLLVIKGTDTVAGRICRLCRTPKPLSEFSKSSECLGGVEGTCKVCKRLQNNASYHRHKKLKGRPAAQQKNKDRPSQQKKEPRPVCLECGEETIKLTSAGICRECDFNRAVMHGEELTRLDPIVASLNLRMTTYAAAVAEHIETYTIGQYNDYPHDNATRYTPAECLWQIRKYITRYGQGARCGEQARDMLKIGHYCCIAVAKLAGSAMPPKFAAKTPIGRQSYRVREWHGYMAYLSRYEKLNAVMDTVHDDVFAWPDDLARPMRRIIDAAEQSTSIPAADLIPMLVALTLHAARIWTELEDRQDGISCSAQSPPDGVHDSPRNRPHPALVYFAQEGTLKQDNHTSRTLVLDFTDYPGMYDAIRDLAFAQFRTPEAQAMYLLHTRALDQEAA